MGEIKELVDKYNAQYGANLYNSSYTEISTDVSLFLEGSKKYDQLAAKYSTPEEREMLNIAIWRGHKENNIVYNKEDFDEGKILFEEATLDDLKTFMASDAFKKIEGFLDPIEVSVEGSETALVIHQDNNGVFTFENADDFSEEQLSKALLDNYHTITDKMQTFLEKTIKRMDHGGFFDRAGNGDLEEFEKVRDEKILDNIDRDFGSENYTSPKNILQAMSLDSLHLLAENSKFTIGDDYGLTATERRDFGSYKADDESLTCSVLEASKLKLEQLEEEADITTEKQPSVENTVEHKVDNEEQSQTQGKEVVQRKVDPKVLEAQAYLKALEIINPVDGKKFDPDLIDGIHGTKTKTAMDEYAKSLSDTDLAIEGCDKMNAEELTDAVMDRINKQIAQNPDLRNRVMGATVAMLESGDKQQIKAGQVLLNDMSFKDNDNIALAVDGDPGPKTTSALNTLKNLLDKGAESDLRQKFQEAVGKTYRVHERSLDLVSAYERIKTDIDLKLDFTFAVNENGKLVEIKNDKNHENTRDQFKNNQKPEELKGKITVKLKYDPNDTQKNEGNSQNNPLHRL